MASGSFTKTIRKDKEYIKVWWASGQKGSENKSTVDVYAKIYRPTKITSSANKKITTTIDGNSKSNTVKGWGGKGWTAAFGGHSVVVNHNSDGTKSVKIKVTAHLGLNLGSKHYDNVTAEATVKLDTLPVKSTINWQSLSSGTGTACKIGDSLTFYLNRSSSTVRHSITGKIGQSSFTILKKSDDNGTQKTITINTADYIKYMEKSSDTLTITCTTYKSATSSASLGTSTISTKLSINPTTNSPSITDVTTEFIPVDHTNSSVLIQGKSKLQLTITAAKTPGDYGEIQSYNLKDLYTGNTIKSSSNVITTDVIGKVGTPLLSTLGQYELYVTDKRGVSSAISTLNIPVVEYYVPIQKGFDIYRCKSQSDTSKDLSGTYVSIDAKFDFASVENTNSINVVIESKQTNSDAYTLLDTFSNVTSNSISGVYGGFSQDHSYNFKFTVTDAYGASVTFVPDELTTEAVLIDLSPTNGIGIGKVVERENAFEVDLESWFNKPVHANVVALTSDARMKTIISRDIDLLKSAWRDIGITLFRYNGSNKQYVGVIAQELMGVFEKYNLDWRDYGIFHKDTDGYFSVDYNSIFAITTYMAQIAFDKLDELEEKINRLYDHITIK